MDIRNSHGEGVLPRKQMNVRLSKVQITNFRSIKNLSLTFDEKCQVLVGINESGKSNVLDAVALLDDTRKIDTRDLRAQHPNEKPTDSEITYVFDLPDSYVQFVYGEVSKEIAVGDQPIVLVDNIRKTFKDFATTCFRTACIDIALPKEGRLPKYYTVQGSLCADLFIPTVQCPADKVIPTLAGEPIFAAKARLVEKAHIGSFPANAFRAATFEDVAQLIGSRIASTLKAYLPRIVSWRYVESNLLPAEVDCDTFAADPNVCIPLRNLFWLAGITKIKAEIEKARNGPAQAFRNLLSKVGKKATSHFRSIWKDYDKIKFELLPDGEMIQPAVRDVHNHYEFSQRSDGFKRFVSFLLTMSVDARTNKDGGAILLIDEPEIGLHPSGARYLRDELFRIAEKNLVMYSTHSIFMIDSRRIERHRIVRKKSEVTTLEVAARSNIIDEEVLYNALGWSVFESLKPRNLLFEGWRDKRLCDVAMEAVPSEHEGCEVLSELGRCHGSGVKSLNAIATMIELAAREVTILSDADEVSVQHQSVYQANRGGAKWLTYLDVLGTRDFETAEDFLLPTVLGQAAKQLATSYELDTPPDFETARPSMASVDRWLRRNNRADSKKLLNEMKEILFDALKRSHIRAEYYHYLRKLAELLH